MSDLNRVAKQMYNVSPDPLRLTLDDGTTAVFELSSAEFFQTEFQAEGTRRDEDGSAYRFTTDDDNTGVLVGKQREDGSWTLVGAVTDVERVDS